MRAVWIRAVGDVRRRLAATLSLVLIVGLGGGVVLTAVAGARRTRSSLDRMRAFTGDGQIGLHPPLPLQQVLAIPGVAEAGSYAYMFLTLPDEPDGGAKVVPFFAGDDRAFRTVDAGLLLAGRRADPARFDEVVVSAGMASHRGLRVGSGLRIRLSTEEEIADLFQGKSPSPRGPIVSVRVVGITRSPLELVATDESQDVNYLGGSEGMYLTQAMYLRYIKPAFSRDPLFLGGMDVRLTDPSRASSVRASLAKLLGPSGDIGDRSETLKPAQRALDVQSTALLAFGFVAGACTLLIAGQGLVREIFLAADDNAALSALGMTPRNLQAVSLARATAIGASGAAVAVCLAIAGSAFLPIGLGRLAEPTPGVSIDWLVLTLGAASITLVFAFRATPPAWRAAHVSNAGQTDEIHASRAGLWLARAGAGPSIVTGVRFALQRDRGTASIPVRTTIAGVVVALASTTASLTLGSSLAGLVRTPERYGWTWDVMVGNPNNGDPEDPSVDKSTARASIEHLSADPKIAAFAGGIGFPVDIAGVHSSVLALSVDHGNLFPPVINGRQPLGRGEMTISRALARDAHLHVGSDVPIRSGTGERTMKVVGVAVGTGIGTAAQMSSDEAAFASLASVEGVAPPQLPPYLFFVRYASGVTHTQENTSLRSYFGPVVLEPLLPADVRNFDQIRWAPYALVGLLLLVGTATVAHMLLTSVRVRRRELGVLKTLGFVRRQVSMSVAAQASTLGFLSLAFGLPAGVILARLMWGALAERAGLIAVTVIPGIPLALVGAGTLLLSNTIAAVPGWLAGRISAATVLRAE